MFAAKGRVVHTRCTGPHQDHHEAQIHTCEGDGRTGTELSVLWRDRGL